MIVYHMSAEPYISGKIYQMMAEAFGTPPGVFYGYMRLFNVAFVAGAAARDVPPADPAVLARLSLPYERSHDDWPYLYLRERTVPAHYLAALLAALLVAALMMGIGGGAAIGRGFDGAMFFMGAGFLLVETKSVTEMSLLFGSTWTVNLLVFASIMIMVLAANLLIMRRPLTRHTPLFGGLFITLAIAYVLPASSLLTLGIWGQWFLGGLMVAAPIFQSAILRARVSDHRITLHTTA